MLARTSIESLPIPGIVIGGYPERPRDPGQVQDGMWRRLREYLPMVDTAADRQDFAREVAARRELLEPLSDESFQVIVDFLRKQLFTQGCERGPQAQALACAAEAARRVMGWVPYPAQIMAARVLLQNRLAEMQTGEGKTFAIALAASVAAMAGIPVHVVTANEYLVKRDAALFQPLYARLRLSVDIILGSQDTARRARAYACDIAYCTAKELAFDYLKDGLLRGRDRHELQHRVGDLLREEARGPRPMMRGLCMAIVDEADSVLIDEAGTPLILARAVAAGGEVSELRQALRVARNLRPTRHYRLTEMRAELTDEARVLLGMLAAGGPVAWQDARRLEEVITQALAALHCYQRDRHYVVNAGKVCIVDQTTGRLADGRAWSRGLHQLIELKEGCAATGRQEPIAQITYQRFFPRYLRLSGTSGTLTEARRELRADYGLGVSAVPLRVPGRRLDQGLRVLRDDAAKWQCVVGRVRDLTATGRPVLIGTDSVAGSERLSACLAQAGIAHQMLNARQDAEEASLVACAGEIGRVTVTTNMAGRGTDIVLGEGVAALGGLHVINCQLNAEARIDRQLHGRAGRQGDPGSVETVLSLEEPLIVRHLPLPVRAQMGRLAACDEQLPAWLSRPLVRLCQWREECALRAARRELMRRDAINERRLSLSGGAE